VCSNRRRFKIEQAAVSGKLSFCVFDRVILSLNAASKNLAIAVYE